MTIRTNTNEKFILTLCINVEDITVTLRDVTNGNIEITSYRADQLQRAIEQYNQLTILYFKGGITK